MTDYEPPTEDEIRRVKDYHARQSRIAAEDSLARKREIERKELELRSSLLVGRRIDRVTGDQDYANWRSLVLHFDDDTAIVIAIDRWGDSPELELSNVHDIPDERVNYPEAERYTKKIGGRH